MSAIERIEYNDRVEFRLDGWLHREDGPSIEWHDGDLYWHFKGKYHREDGPAIEEADGTRAWYRHGRLHREDGPAVETPDGKREWWWNGELLSGPEQLADIVKIKRDGGE